MRRITIGTAALLVVTVLGLMPAALGSAASGDTNPPVLSLPSNMTVNATSASDAVVTFAASATDDVDGTVPVTCTPASGAAFPLGVTTVGCSAKDAAGNAANGTFTVTVSTTILPTLHLPANMTVGATGASGAVVTFAATATDLFGAAVPITCTPASGATFPIGVTTVNCNAKDAVGNTANGSFTVSVSDQTPPTLHLPANIATEATGASGSTVTFTVTATDAVDPSPTVTCSPASGATFPIGVTTVNCSAKDAAGNAANGTFTVTVSNKTPPTLHLPANVAAEATSASGAAVVFTATATDLVGASVAVTCTPASGATFPLGVTTVNCSATDAAGNTTGGSFTVTVADTTPPTIALAGPADAARITVAAVLSASGVGDNVAVGGVTFRYCDSTAGSCTPANGKSAAGVYAGGTGWTAATDALTDGHSYTWDAVAADTTGHTTTTGTRTFTIDTSVPTIVLPGDLTVEANGPTGSTVTYKVSGSDNGEALLPTAITCVPASGSLFAVGSATVVCSTTPDPGGNVGRASFKVRVADTTPPQLAVPGDFGVYATSDAGVASGDSAVASVLGVAKAVDIVDPHPVVTNNAPAVLPHGTTTVTFTAKDSAGNTATKVTHITVTDRPAGSSGGSAPAPVVKTVDTTAPADPSLFVAKVGPGYITLTWKLPTDSDLDHVEVFRSVQQRTTAAPVEARVYSGTGTSFVDKGVKAATAYRYLIVSVDKTGNRSAGAAVGAVAKAVMLLAPASGARVSRVPTLKWKAVAGTTYYNVQLYRNAVKVLSAWPTGTAMQLRLSWTFNGTTFRLQPGSYHWYVWPGLGARADGRYGPVLGDSTFTVLAGVKP